MIHTIIVDARKQTALVIVKTTFRLYRNDPESFEVLYNLSHRIFRETGLEVELLLRGDKILHLTHHKITKGALLLRKIEVAIAIIKEVYEIPNARVQIQQGLF